MSCSTQRTARLRLTILLLGDLVAIGWLHRMGDWASVPWGDRRTWFDADPEAVLTAGVRVVALVLAYWLLAGTLAYAWSATQGRRLHWLTLPGVRRLVDRALALGLATSTLLAPAAAVASESPPIPVVIEIPAPEARPEVRLPVELSPTDAEVTAPAAAAAPAATHRKLRTPTERSVAQPAITSYVVQPGDCMWTIAAERLGAGANDADIARYWVSVIDANRDTIRSGDPDLIHPGEALTLPALP